MCFFMEVLPPSFSFTADGIGLTDTDTDAPFCMFYIIFGLTIVFSGFNISPASINYGSAILDSLFEKSSTGIDSSSMIPSFLRLSEDETGS